jgi:hypothetical protein
MKTRSVAALALVTIIAFSAVSCDQALNLMGKMGTNVYGFSASTQEAVQTAAKVDGSVSYQSDGDAQVDWSSAASVAGDFQAISESKQQTEAFLSEMNKPVSDKPEEAEAVSDAMKQYAEEKSLSVLHEASETQPGPERDAMIAMANSMATVASAITDSPTRADLATVAMVGKIAEDSMEFLKLSESQTDRKNEISTDVLSIIMTLRTMRGAGEISASMANLDVASVIGEKKDISPSAFENMGKKDIVNRLTEAIKPSLIAVREGMESEGQYSQEAHKNLVMNLASLRSAYEAWCMMSNTYTDPVEDDAVQVILGNKNIPLCENITFDDIVLYAVSVIVTENAECYLNISAFLNGEMDATEAFEPLARVRRTLYPTFVNTAGVLVHVSGWGNFVSSLAGDELTGEKIRELFEGGLV